MTLLFVRHGESEGNVGRIMQGWLDTPLSEVGARQAEAVAACLATSGATRVYASTLRRAWDTAARIAEASGAPLEAADAFREYHLGEAQGLLWDEVVERYGVTTETWGTGLIPGEEGLHVFRSRLVAAFEELAERHRDDIAIVVSHGGAIARLVVYVLGAPPEAYLPFATPGNTSITTIAWDRDRLVLAGLNDTCHLATLTDASPPPSLVRP